MVGGLEGGIPTTPFGVVGDASWPAGLPPSVAAAPPSNCRTLLFQRQHLLTLHCCQLPPFPRREIAEAELPDALPEQTEGGMADRGRHPPDLAVAALREGQLDPDIADRFPKTDGRFPQRDDRRRIEQARPGGLRAAARNLEAVRKSSQGFGRRLPLDQHPISARVTFLRIEQSGVQIGLIGEQKKALAVGIQPTERINVRREAELSQCPVRRTVGSKLRQHAVGLVKRDQHGRWEA